jgi:hypothetical protein
MGAAYPTVKRFTLAADIAHVTSPRALSLLAGLSAPIFLAAAVAGWLLGAWPATPLTFLLAAAVVCGGPVLGLLHAATARPEREPAPAPVPAAPPVVRPAPLPLTHKAAAARAFLGWRDSGT